MMLLVYSLVKHLVSSRVLFKLFSMNNVIWVLDKLVILTTIFSFFYEKKTKFDFCLGAIYLKNHVNAYWSDRTDASATIDPDILTLAEAVNVNVPKVNGEHSTKPSPISDADKDYLRNVLIDAIIRTKDPLR